MLGLWLKWKTFWTFTSAKMILGDPLLVWMNSPCHGSRRSVVCGLPSQGKQSGWTTS